MQAHAEGEDATALSPCAEDGCGRAQWSVHKRGRGRPPVLAVISKYCREHSELPMLDVPAEPVYVPAPAKGEPRTFQQAVAQRREQREQGEAS
jgi:hypothetical protein